MCFCGRAFARNDLLKRHKQRSHMSAQTQPEGASTAPDATTRADTTMSMDEGLFGNEDSVSPGDEAILLSPVPDFAAFMESIGLAPDWTSLGFSDVGSSALQRQANTAHNEPAAFPGSVESIRAASLPPGSSQQTLAIEATQIPHLGPTSNIAEANIEAATAGPLSTLWRVTDRQWHAVVNRIALSQETLQGFALPSRLAMSRYLQSYASHFHKRYPLIHLPIYCLESSPIWRTLAMAAIGAQNQREQKNGHMLYRAARTLTWEQRAVDSRSPHVPDERRTAVIQTLVLLMAYGAWDWDTELLDGALDLQIVLHDYIRGSIADDVPTNHDSLQWSSWIRAETRRRAIMIAYAYLGIQSMAYDLPPVVLTREIQDLQLPSSSSAWEARTEQEWKDAMLRAEQTPVRCLDALRHLLGHTSENRSTDLHFSSTASFVVLQALIQRIFFVRQIHSTSGAALPSVELRSFQWVLTHSSPVYI